MYYLPLLLPVVLSQASNWLVGRKVAGNLNHSCSVEFPFSVSVYMPRLLDVLRRHALKLQHFNCKGAVERASEHSALVSHVSVSYHTDVSAIMLVLHAEIYPIVCGGCSSGRRLPACYQTELPLSESGRNSGFFKVPALIHTLGHYIFAKSGTLVSRAATTTLDAWPLTQ